MPVQIQMIYSTEALVLTHSCDGCGTKDAPFGVGVSFRKALNAQVKGKLHLLPELLGKWYCLICWRLIK